MTQLSLLGRSVRVRPTSMAARHSIASSEISRVQSRIVSLLRYGPLSDEVIAREYRASVYPPVSDSGLRTRRSELVKAGKVKQVGETRNSRGLKVALWGLV